MFDISDVFIVVHHCFGESAFTHLFKTITSNVCDNKHGCYRLEEVIGILKFTFICIKRSRTQLLLGLAILNAL